MLIRISRLTSLKVTLFEFGIPQQTSFSATTHGDFVMFQNLNHIRANTRFVIVDVTGCQRWRLWLGVCSPSLTSSAFAFFMIWRSFFGATRGAMHSRARLTPLNRFANRLPMTYGIVDCLGDHGDPRKFTESVSV